MMLKHLNFFLFVLFVCLVFFFFFFFCGGGGGFGRERMLLGGNGGRIIHLISISCILINLVFT